jgi:hypothetical protein
MQFINQFSFLWIAGISFLGFFLFLLRRGMEALDWLALSALIIGLSIAFVLLKPAQVNYSQEDEILEKLGKGTPVLLEFESEY